jgi:hypothetical protein
MICVGFFDESSRADGTEPEAAHSGNASYRGRGGVSGPPHASCGPPWSAVTSRPGFMGTHTGRQGAREVLCAEAGPRSLHAEMKPTGRALTIFPKYGRGCLANFTREEGPSGSHHRGHAHAEGRIRTFSRRGRATADTFGTSLPHCSEQVADARYS